MLSFKEYRSTSNYFPNYVHGSHASDDSISEALSDIELNKRFRGYDPNTGKSKYDYIIHPSQQVIKRRQERLPNTFGELYPMIDKTADTHEFDSLEKLDEHLNEKADIKNNLPKDTLNSARDYTRSSSHINKGLLHRKMNNLSYKKNDIQNIDSAFDTSKAPRDYATYSGLGFNPKSKMNEKGVMHSPAYLSSSTSPAVAVGFAKNTNPDESDRKLHYNILKINNKKGDPILPVESITQNTKEHEHILPRGINFKIDSEPEIHELSTGHLIHIWNATPIHHESDEARHEYNEKTLADVPNVEYYR